MFLVDAFADGLFSGGRAGVALLRHLGQEVFLQALAQEMCLPVTAYVLPFNNDFMVRYFTPEQEIGVADYASLAAAHVLFGVGLAPVTRPVLLHGRGGRRQISPDFERGAGFLRLTLERAARERLPGAAAERVGAALGLTAEEILGVFSSGMDHLLVCCREQVAIRDIPGGAAAAALGAGFSRLTLSGPVDMAGLAGYCVRCFTAAGELTDIPFNFDLHAVLAPFWAEQFGCRRLEVHHQAVRTCLLWSEVGEGSQTVTISGQLCTIFKADPVLSELISDAPQDLVF